MNIYGGGMKTEMKAEYFYDNGQTIRYKKLTDDDIKFLFQNIKMNNIITYNIFNYCIRINTFFFHYS